MIDERKYVPDTEFTDAVATALIDLFGPDGAKEVARRNRDHESKFGNDARTDAWNEVKISIEFGPTS